MAMAMDWKASVVCFGEKNEIAELKKYFEKVFDDLEKARATHNRGDGPFYLTEDAVFNREEHGVKLYCGNAIDILSVNFPLISTHGIEETFAETIEKFKKTTFIAAGQAEVEPDVYNMYYAAKNGTVIDTASYEFAYNDEDTHFEDAERDFGEFFADFLEESVVAKVNLFQEKALCMELLKLCHKYNELASCAYKFWSEFPKDFWLDEECVSHLPQAFWDTDFWLDLQDSYISSEDFWNGENACAALLLKHNSEILQSLPEAVKKKAGEFKDKLLSTKTTS